MKRIIVAAVVAVGIAGTILVSGCVQSMTMLSVDASGKGDTGGPDTFVTLAMVDGTCKATGGVGVLGGKRNLKITWYVNNGCGKKQFLTITHYQEHLDPTDPTKLGPVVTDVIDPDPLYDEIRSGASGQKVKGRIDKDNQSGKNKIYKYWICIGDSPRPMTNCLDPDVDVWP